MYKDAYKDTTGSLVPINNDTKLRVKKLGIISASIFLLPYVRVGHSKTLPMRQMIAQPSSGLFPCSWKASISFFKKMGHSRPLFVYFRFFYTSQFKYNLIKAYMVCLGFEPGAAEWKVQTNPLSYDGTPGFYILYGPFEFATMIWFDYLKQQL